MAFCRLLPLLPLLLVLWPAAAAPPDTLRLVHVLYRHGARTPIDRYPADPNPAWPQGDGQLTNEGKRNQLELGRWLRERYDGFLPAAYHKNFTRVESTDIDRTLMSAQANLAGMFPPQGEDVWDAELPWQPIPVHTTPTYTDLKLRSYDSCAAHVRERDRVLASPEVEAINQEYAALYSYLSTHSGADVHDVETADYLHDTLWIEAGHNLSTPAWATAVPPNFTAPAFPDLTGRLADLHFGLFGRSALQRRLGGGPLLRDMVANMRAAIAGSLQPPTRRLFAYSAHDNNVACLLTTLQVYNGIAPPLASCVLVELHADAAAGHVVRLLYRNDSSVEPYRLQLPGCAPDCPWQSFVTLTAAVVPADVAHECQADGYVSRRPLRRT